MFEHYRHVVTNKQKRLVSFPFTPKFFEGPMQATASGHFFLYSIKKSPQQISLRGFFSLDNALPAQDHFSDKGGADEGPEKDRDGD